MQIILRILKEVGIAIVLLGLLLLIGYFLFKNQVPFLNSDIPNAVEYKGIDYAEYNIEGDLENQKDPTKRYETTTNNLRVLETERKVQTGAPNPFVTTNSEPDSDLPTETVSIDNAAIPTDEELAYGVAEGETVTSNDSSTDSTVSADSATQDNGEPKEREL